MQGNEICKMEIAVISCNRIFYLFISYKNISLKKYKEESIYHFKDN